MIIETSDNRLFSVRETGNPDLAHVWTGHPVKRVRVPAKFGGGFVYALKAGAVPRLVRKEATTVVSEGQSYV